MTPNMHYSELKDSYLFFNIAQKIKAYLKAHPGEHLYRMGIGDVSLPLCDAVIKALYEAVDDQASPERFHGYMPEPGAPFLREAIAAYYQDRGVDVSVDEVFVSSGASDELGDILDLFDRSDRAMIIEPAYPAYVDANVIAGRQIIHLPSGRENGFLPDPRMLESLVQTGEENGAASGQTGEKNGAASGQTRSGAKVISGQSEADPQAADGQSEAGLAAGNGLPAAEAESALGPELIYICSPNNPTGAVFSRTQLQKWVDYANANGSVILFDAAYEAFIEDDTLPHSIFELDGAKTCAIEICSLSKTAGFTGTRLGYTVIPKDLIRQGMSLNAMWIRNRTTKTNGVSYIIQKGGAAVFTPEGQRQIHENIQYYKENARILMAALDEVGIWYCGGKNAPYIWLRCPNGMGSWEFFDFLLNEIQIVGTPGEGFGACGEGYFRFSTFGNREDTMEAARRLVERLKNPGK